MTNKAADVPDVTLGDELSVSAIGFGAMALTPVYGEVDDTESLATLHSEVGVERAIGEPGHGGAEVAVVQVVTSVADAAAATAAQVALAWLRYRADALGVVAVPIPGTRRASRVEENLGSLSVTLTADQLAALDAAAAAVSGNRFRDMSWVSAGRE